MKAPKDNINEKKIRDVIRQELRKLRKVNETDLVANDKTSWDTMKQEFQNLVSSLLTNIQQDDYKDADGQLSKAIKILKTWKSKIDKGITDNSINENADNWAMDTLRYNLGDEFSEFIIPGSESAIDEDGHHSVEVQLAIPKEYFADLETATMETEKQLGGYNYNGPGQKYSKSHVYAIKQNAKYYILGYHYESGYDI